MVDSLEQTNNFYDNEPTQQLPMVALYVDGEVANPDTVNFAKLPIHSVIVKEALLNTDGTNKFIGAYRYGGYSLFDILNTIKVNKKNADVFPPIIDLYIEVSNDAGEKVVFSWGELYYPNNLHKIIIASSVMRIVPSKTKDLWPLPTTSRLVVGNDLLTERNISNPTKITVRSLDASFKIDKDLKPLFCEKVKLVNIDGKEGALSISKALSPVTFNTIFYGRGRGIHSTTPFTGYYLKDILASTYPISRENIQRGIFTIAGLDGYRMSVTYSELFNRNDQQDFLLIDDPKNMEGGRYKLFPACDFFSDRAIKVLSEIRYEVQ
ncbi:hypothetical protein CYCD_01880 [Tenuifilaceae bacterium CYCD]|nr:hypothetical protein CYCD_01880 [Tenuifilaceae bacterium CYCD]